MGYLLVRLQKDMGYQKLKQLERYPYPALLWSVISCLPTEYGKIIRISPHSVQMQENTDQNNSEYGHFLRSNIWWSFHELSQFIFDSYKADLTFTILFCCFTICSDMQIWKLITCSRFLNVSM